MSRPRGPSAVMLSVLLLTASWYLGSRLSLVPVPWPDATAYYVPGLELVHWPPNWRMHPQAAFIPSYDEACFNIPPGLPFLFGVSDRLGITKLFDIQWSLRALSLLALFAWVWILWRWLFAAWRARGEGLAGALALSGVVAIAALWDPGIRWGTMAVRTEPWVGLAWLLVLRELATKEKSPWKIAAGLALGAYFHFAAIIMVPATALGLALGQVEAGPGGLVRWVRRLFAVGWRTLLLFSPWVIYALTYLGLFREQMQIQFQRLSGRSHFVTSPYEIVHRIFAQMGSPAELPRFFNLAKGDFWILVVLMVVVTAWRGRRKSRGAESAVVPAAVAFLSALYLWIVKPEVWFTTLVHYAFWPALGLVLLELRQNRGLRKSLLALTAGFAAISAAATFSQSLRIPASVSWPVYLDWVDCIDRAISAAPHAPNQKIWQPHVPDALVELVHRHPGLDVTRSLDFGSRRELAWRYSQKADAILFSRLYFEPAGAEPVSFEGPPRATDAEKMKDDVELPFGPEGLRLPVEAPGQWRFQVCQRGAFWAEVAIRSLR